MEVSCSFQAPAAFLRGKNLGTNWMRGLLCLSVGLDAVAKRKIELLHLQRIAPRACSPQLCLYIENRYWYDTFTWMECSSIYALFYIETVLNYALKYMIRYYAV